MPTRPKLLTLSEALYWSYANMAMAHFALTNELVAYDRACFAIRSRLYKGLSTGKMKVTSLYDDEKERLRAERECVYCRGSASLSLDHLIARAVGGSDSADNLVYACRSCNSSKNERDLLFWYSTRGEFPPILILRRYLKLLVTYCDENNLMDWEYEKLDGLVTPFRIDLIPLDCPHPERLRL